MSAGVQLSACEPIGSDLALRWSDGAESYVSLRTLRRHCPCAACGGEPDLLRPAVRNTKEPGPSGFVLAGMNRVGGYALQPVWGDGHSTGIYSFEYLRRLPESGEGAD
jgi:DUF971 family protein